MKLVDVHAHLNDDKFGGDLDEVVDNYLAVGVGAVINSGYDMPSSLKAAEIAEKYESAYFSAGVHPDDAKYFDLSAEKTLESLLKHEKCVAAGEIGFDFYWNKSDEESQRRAFLRQMQIADYCGKPFVVHSREANAKTLAFLRENYKLINRGFLMHCYAGSAEDVKNYAELGAYFSFGGVITFKNCKKESVIAAVPQNRILTETDCPYLTPEPFRGKRNEPAYVRFALEKIAAIKGEDKEFTAEYIAGNAKKLFGV